MTYINVIFRYGTEKFMKRCVECGILGAMTKIVKENTDVPCAIGFGIGTPKQAKEMSVYAEGVIVGSAIVKIVAKYGKDSVSYVGEYVKEMNDAII